MITAESKLRPLMTNIIPITDATGDGVVQLEMSINPLSVIYLRVNALNNTGTLGNYANYFNLAAAVPNVQLSYRGQSIINMSLQDIVALNWLRWGILPEEANPNNVDNERREIIVPIFLGKMPFDTDSCFPATRRGDLTLRLTLDDANTGYDNLQYGVDTLEMLGAMPKEFERKLTLQRTNSATGTNDLDLVPRRLNRGLLLFGTTGWNGATPAPSFSQVRVLLDNQELWYSGLDWQVLASLPAMWGRHRSWLEHKHVQISSGNAETTESSGSPAQPLVTDWQKYGYLDFDVTRDDAYSIDATNCTRFQLRHVAGTADAVRCVQMEVVPVSDGDFPKG